MLLQLNCIVRNSTTKIQYQMLHGKCFKMEIWCYKLKQFYIVYLVLYMVLYCSPKQSILWLFLRFPNSFSYHPTISVLRDPTLLYCGSELHQEGYGSIIPRWLEWKCVHLCNSSNIYIYQTGRYIFGEVEANESPEFSHETNLLNELKYSSVFLCISWNCWPSVQQNFSPFYSISIFLMCIPNQYS